jgi:hypothetical protein
MDQSKELIKMLDSPKASVRYDACEALRVTPSVNDAAIAALERTSSDSDPDVREAAQRALNVHHTELPPESRVSPSAVVMKPDKRNSLAMTGLVTSLLSLIAWLLPVCGAPLAISAVVLGFLSRHSSRRRMALASVVLGTIGLVLALGNAALGMYLGRPSEALEQQLIAVETASFAQSHPEAVIVQVTTEFRRAGSVLPQDRANGVTRVRCYTTHITFSTALGSCESAVRNRVLALVDGQWHHDIHDQAGGNAWTKHNCGDIPLYLAPVPCSTPSPVPLEPKRS